MIFSELQKKDGKWNQLMDKIHKDSPKWSFLFSFSHGALYPLPIVQTALLQATVCGNMSDELSVKKLTQVL